MRALHHCWTVCALCLSGMVLGIGFADAAATYGTRFQVNTLVTAGDQTNPEVAVNKYGAMLVVWENPTTDGDIFWRMWFPDGTSTLDTRLNTFTAGTQQNPQVAALAAGAFAVVWSSDTCILDICNPDYDSIVAQVVTPAATTLSEDAFVGQYTNTIMEVPDVAPLAEGFVVVWASLSGPGDDTDMRIEASKHAVTGQRIGSEFQINLNGTGWQFDPAVAERPFSGGFYTMFSSDPSPFVPPADDRDIRRRTVNADGSFHPAETLEAWDAEVARPDIAVNAADNYLMAWEDGLGIVAESVSRCHAGESFTDLGGSGNGRPRVAALPWNGFVLTHSNRSVIEWHLVDDTDFGADGGVLTGVGTDLGEHGLAALRSGGFIAVWDEGAMMSTIPGATDVNRGIAAVIISFDTVFKDGFECAETAFWSATAP